MTRLNHRLNVGSVDLSEMFERLMQIPHDGLRRHVARMVWFDVSDQVWTEPEQRELMSRLLKVADPEFVDDRYDFSEEDFCQVLLLIGYSTELMLGRLKTHQQHRRILMKPTTMTERERLDCASVAGGVGHRQGLYDT